MLTFVFGKKNVMLIQTYRETKPLTSGLFAGYRTFAGADGSPDRHVMTLWNLSEYRVSLDVQSHCGANKEKFSGMLKAYEGVALQTFPHEAISDKPGFSGTVRAYTTENAGKVSKIEYKVKPPKFVKQAIANLASRKEWFELILDWNAKPSEVLEKLAIRKTNQPEEAAMYSAVNLQKKASFPAFIDLHIDKLTPLHEKMGAGDIIKLQLKTFEEYLEAAIIHKVSPVFIVHGKGKGKLRTEITERLKNNKDVTEFSNTYDPKYGFGATKVWL